MKNKNFESILISIDLKGNNGVEVKQLKQNNNIIIPLNNENSSINLSTPNEQLLKQEVWIPREYKEIIKNIAKQNHTSMKDVASTMVINTIDNLTLNNYN